MGDTEARPRCALPLLLTGGESIPRVLQDFAEANFAVILRLNGGGLAYAVRAPDLRGSMVRFFVLPFPCSALSGFFG